MGLLFTATLIFATFDIQAFNISLVPYLKCFGTSQLEFQTVELY